MLIQANQRQIQILRMRSKSYGKNLCNRKICQIYRKYKGINKKMVESKSILKLVYKLILNLFMIMNQIKRFYRNWKKSRAARVRLLSNMFLKNYRTLLVRDYLFNQGKLIYIKLCHLSQNVKEKCLMKAENKKVSNKFMSEF